MPVARTPLRSPWIICLTLSLAACGAEKGADSAGAADDAAADDGGAADGADGGGDGGADGAADGGADGADGATNGGEGGDGATDGGEGADGAADGGADGSDAILDDEGALSALEIATAGLWYTSESDYPLEVIIFADPGVELSAANATTLLAPA